jgi:hypothetical protein
VRKQGVRQEALRGLHYLFLSGEEMSRGEFKAMLGMRDRGATDALGALVKRGLLKSDSPQGKVRFGLELNPPMLSDVLSNNTSIDSPFLDDGFGSLYGGTLVALDSLNAGRKMIGVVIHMEGREGADRQCRSGRNR